MSPRGYALLCLVDEDGLALKAQRVEIHTHTLSAIEYSLVSRFGDTKSDVLSAPADAIASITELVVDPLTYELVEKHTAEIRKTSEGRV